MPYPHQFVKLTDQERKTLEEAIKQARRENNTKKATRLQIIYLSDQGLHYRLIAGRTNYSYAAVRYWIYRYRKEGLKPLLESK